MSFKSKGLNQCLNFWHYHFRSLHSIFATFWMFKTAVPILALHNTNLLYSISIDHLSHYLPNKKNIPVNTPSPKNKVQNMVQQPTFLPLNPSLQGPDIGAKVKGPNIAIAINAWTSNDVHQVIFHHGLMSIPDHPGFWRFQKWRQELWCFFGGGRGGLFGVLL